jgi:type IV secretory pathway VirJ component
MKITVLKYLHLLFSGKRSFRAAFVAAAAYALCMVPCVESVRTDERPVRGGNGFHVEESRSEDVRREPFFPGLIGSLKSLPLVRRLFLPAVLRGLPLVVDPAFSDEGGTFAVLLSGDGGWAGIDRRIATLLVKRGVPVVGFSTLAYYLRRRSPEESSKDIARVIRYYSREWKKENVLLVGYSYGADVLPFIVRRFGHAILSEVGAVAFIGLGETVDFKFHIGVNWLGFKPRRSSRSVPAEVEKLKGLRLLCIRGTREKDSGCRNLGPASSVVTLAVDSGHGFRGEQVKIVDFILEQARSGFRQPENYP